MTASLASAGACLPPQVYSGALLLVPKVLWALLSSSTRSFLREGWLPCQIRASPEVGAEPGQTGTSQGFSFSPFPPSKSVPQSSQHRLLWWALGPGNGSGQGEPRPRV